MNTLSIRSTLANGTLHFDNSGSETDRLELDPTGNSIGFDGYEYGNFGYTPPPDDFGGFPRFTGSHGETYSLNGIRIPREYAMDLASSELYGYGGIFGLLERRAKASQPRYLGATVRYRNGQEYDVTNKTVFEGGETVTRWWLVNDSWTVGDSLKSILDRIRKARDEEPLTTTSVQTATTISERPLEVYKTPCDQILSKIFGDSNSWVAGSNLGLVSTTTKPISERRPTQKIVAEPSDESGPIIHKYDQSSTNHFGNVQENVYVPNGFTENGLFSVEASDRIPDGKDGWWFYYPDTKSTLLVLHVEAKKVQASLKSGITNSMGSSFIGKTSLGGGEVGFIHNHIEWLSGKYIPSGGKAARGPRWINISDFICGKDRFKF